MKRGRKKKNTCGSAEKREKKKSFDTEKVREQGNKK